MSPSLCTKSYTLLCDAETLMLLLNELLSKLLFISTINKGTSKLLDTFQIRIWGTDIIFL